MVILGLIVLAFIIILLYSCLVVSSRNERLWEKMSMARMDQEKPQIDQEKKGEQGNETN